MGLTRPLFDPPRRWRTSPNVIENRNHPFLSFFFFLDSPRRETCPSAQRIFQAARSNKINEIESTTKASRLSINRPVNVSSRSNRLTPDLTESSGIQVLCRVLAKVDGRSITVRGSNSPKRDRERERGGSSSNSQATSFFLS